MSNPCFEKIAVIRVHQGFTGTGICFVFAPAKLSNKKYLTINAQTRTMLATLCLLQAFIWPSRDLVPVSDHQYKLYLPHPQYSGSGILPLAVGEWRQRLMLRGVYRGKTLVVQNPYNDEKGYCVSAVVVNGELNETVASLSEFEIDPGAYGIKPGEEVDIMIEHSRDCIPNITNPEVLR